MIIPKELQIELLRRSEVDRSLYGIFYGTSGEVSGKTTARTLEGTSAESPEEALEVFSKKLPEEFSEHAINSRFYLGSLVFSRIY